MKLYQKQYKKLKIIAFVLVLALLNAIVIVTSVADPTQTDVQITADIENISAGESATVSVKVTTNYPVATMSISPPFIVSAPSHFIAVQYDGS